MYHTLATVAIAKVTGAGVVSTFVSGYSGPIAIFSGTNPPVFTRNRKTRVLLRANGPGCIYHPGSRPKYWLSMERSTNGGATWTPLVNGSTYSGATSELLKVENATTAFSGYEFECVATNAVGSANSSPAVLTNVPFLLYVADEINNTVSTFTPDGHVSRLPCDTTIRWLSHPTQPGTFMWQPRQ